MDADGKFEALFAVWRDAPYGRVGWIVSVLRATFSGMGEAARDRTRDPMSVGEYLVWEKDQRDKHEYHLGEVFAMAGGSLRHNLLSNAIGAELRGALRGKGCHVLSSDQRVSASAGERYVYPDAVVACGGVKIDAASGGIVNPSIIVEVLSTSTEGYDRGEKWGAYQRLASLTDYLLVAQGSIRVEHYQRTNESDVSWRYQVLGPGAVVALTNGAQVAVDAIYEGAFEVEGDGPANGPAAATST